MLQQRANLKRHLPPILLVGLLTLACTPKTGTRASLRPGDLERVHTVGIRVNVERGFSVRVSREQMTNTGAIAGGFIGDMVEKSIRASYDRRLEDELQPALGVFEPGRVMRARLHEYLQRAGVATQTEPAQDSPPSAAHVLDAVLKVTIRDWGFQLCPGPGSAERLQAAISMHGQLVLLPDGRTVWERDELYLHGEGRAAYDLRTETGLLTSVLTQAVDTLSGRIVNDILFP